MGEADKIGRKIVFLTVGTTSFDALVKTVDTQQVRALLIEKGYTDLIIQLGRGSFKPSKIVELIFLGTLSDSEVRTTHKGSFSIHTAVDNNFRIKHSRKLNPSTRHNACWGDAKSPLGIAASGANSHQYWNAKGHSTGEDGALVVDYFTFSPTIVDHLRSASLVISHAGSGSIFETLHLGQPLIVVVNEDLMDNHQCELAEELAERKHLFYARPQTLHETLSNMDLQSLIPYPASDAMPVAKIITRFLGFPED